MASSKTQIHVKATDVHLSVDAEKTFAPGGGLPVPEGDLIVDATKRVMSMIHFNIAVQEIHPYGHISLASSYRSRVRGRTWEPGWLDLKQVIDNDVIVAPHALFTINELREYILRNQDQRIRLWPDHSLFGSPETTFLDGLDANMFQLVFHKGMNPAVDSYSAFRDALRQPTGLTALLDTIQARRIFVTGLAYDFCVGWTAIDAAIDGFEVYVVKDATRAVDIPANGAYPGSIKMIERDFSRFGIRTITSDQLIR